MFAKRELKEKDSKQLFLEHMIEAQLLRKTAEHMSRPHMKPRKYIDHSKSEIAILYTKHQGILKELWDKIDADQRDELITQALNEVEQIVSTTSDAGVGGTLSSVMRPS